MTDREAPISETIAEQERPSTFHISYMV